MDHEYLQHIESSPYVDEGFSPTQLKAGGAALRQRLQNILPGEEGYQTPAYAKLMSFYNTFIGEVKSVLQEFSVGPSSPAERLKKMELTPEEKQLVDGMVNLYETLVPSVFKSKTSSELRGSQASGLVNPQNISLQQAMKHAIKEAWPGRLMARGGGQAMPIIQKYLGDLKKAYTKFITSITKAFPQTPKNMISTFFKRNVDPKVSNNVDKIGEFVKANEPAVPPVIQQPPPIPTSEKPPVIPQQQQGAGGLTPDDFAYMVSHVLNIVTNRVIDDPNSDVYFSKPFKSADGSTEYYLPSTAEEPLPTDPEWLEPEEPSSDAGEEEKAKYQAKMAKYPYTHTYATGSKGEKTATPTGYTFSPSKIVPLKPQTPIPPSPKKFKISEAEDDTAVVKKKDDKKEKDIRETGEFLYDIASLYDKYPGKYSIEVTSEGGVEVPLSKKTIIIRVFWHWEKQKNIIIIKYRTIEENVWHESNLLAFYDDQVNPLSPSYKGRFDINEFLQQSDPRAKQLFSKASPSALSKVEAAIKLFKPAVYAVIRRKGPMEFKSYKDLRLNIRPDFQDKKSENYGAVEVIQGAKIKKGIVPFNVLYDHYHSKDDHESEMWRNALEAIKYAELLPERQKKLDSGGQVEGIPAAMEAMQLMVSPTDGTKPVAQEQAEKALYVVIKVEGGNLSVEKYYEYGMLAHSGKPFGRLETRRAAPPAPVPPSPVPLSPTVKNAIDAIWKISPWDKTPKSQMKDEESKLIKYASQAATELGDGVEVGAVVMRALQLYKKGEAAAPSQVTPEPTLEPEAPAGEAPVATPPSGKTPDDQLAQVNASLEAAGLEKLENTKQMARFFSIKGAWNTKIKKIAQNKDNEKYLKMVLGKKPTPEQKTLWTKLVAKSKEVPSPKKGKGAVEEFVNPFQLANLL